MKTTSDTERRIRKYDPIGDGQSFDELVEQAERAYQAGRRARRAGCYRLLFAPESKAEERRWLSGWDDEDAEIKAAK